MANENLPKGSYQNSNPASASIEMDTTSITSDSINIDSGKQRVDSTDKSQSLSDNLLDAVRAVIFVDTSRSKSYEFDDDFIPSEEPFLPFSGKIIGRIRLRKVEIFGGSVLDTTITPSSWLSKSGNNLHIDTRDRILYENLLFQEGDTLDPYIIGDNERILRELPYIQDAKILVVPQLEQKEVVDIVIITQDVFSIGVSAKVITINNFRINVFDRNFLGLGSEINNGFYYRGDKEQDMGYEFKYIINNIRGTFISASISYLHDFEQEGWRIDFDKDFLVPQTKYAGGLDWSRTAFSAVDSVQVGYTVNSFDTWLGRSFLLKDLPERKNIVLALRYMQDIYTRRPFVSADSNYTYHNLDMILGSITFRNTNYLKSSMILSFGTTEDVPVGLRIQFTGGYSYSEFRKRYYGGVSLGGALKIDKFGYISVVSEVGGFLNNDIFEEGVIKVYPLYFSNLSHLGPYKIRHFIKANYTIGVRRIKNDQIDISDRDGILGLSHESMVGDQRLVFNIETIGFMPWKILGFNIAAVVRSDIGFIGSGDKLPFQEDLYLGFVFGFRIRHEGLVFKTLNFGIGYYPIVPEGASHVGYGFSTSDPSVFEDYLSSKPSIIKFE